VCRLLATHRSLSFPAHPSLPPAKPHRCLPRQTLTLTLTLFAASEAEVAAAVRAACETVGFFYLVGHGVEATLMKEAMMASREYFALTEDEKRRPHDIHGQLLSEAPDFRG
jgi:isopenicillin N synthase-like dioxygenase